MSTSKCLWCGIPFYNISSENDIIFSLERVYDMHRKKKEVNKNDNYIFYNTKNHRRVSVEECLTCYVLDGALRNDTACK